MIGRNTVGVALVCGLLPQGSAKGATLGWKTKSLQDFVSEVWTFESSYDRIGNRNISDFRIKGGVVSSCLPFRYPK